MLNLPVNHDAVELANVMRGLGLVAARLDGCHNFFAGENIDLEGKSPEFSFGFTIDFDDTAALRRYSNDKEHIELGGRLSGLCGGGERIVVFDLRSLD